MAFTALAIALASAPLAASVQLGVEVRQQLEASAFVIGEEAVPFVAWIEKDIWLQLVNCALFAVAGTALYLYRHRKKQQSTLTLGMNSSFQVLLFFGYIGFGTLHMFLQSRAGRTKYSLVSATVLIYCGKALVAFFMHLRTEGPDFSALMRPSGGRFGRMPAVFCTAIPGTLYAIMDVMSFISLSKLDPVTYQIVIHCRIFVTALFWQTFFKVRISGLQWLSMLLFVAASVTKSIDKLQGGSVEAVSSREIGFLVLLGQIAFSAFNTNLSEVLLKELPMMTDLLNCTMYTQGLVCLLLGLMTLNGPSALFTELFSFQAWARLWADPWMVSSIACLIAFGILTAYFLRELSCVLKEMTGPCVTVTSAVVEWGVLRASPCTMVGVESAVIVLGALMVYNIEPVVARNAPANDGKAKKCQQAPGADTLPDVEKCQEV